MRKLVIIIVLAALITGALGLIFVEYWPPFLNREGLNPKEWLLNHLLFAWHYTRSVWLEGVDGGEAAVPARALAVWYHPVLSEEIFGILPTDYQNLARLYESLGLSEEAAQLFELSFEQGAPNPARAREAILPCAGLSAWDEVERIAASAASPAFPEGYYWRGRALIELGRHEDGLSALKAAEDYLPVNGELYFRMGEASEKTGALESAEKYYRRAVELAPLHQPAWDSLAALHPRSGLVREEAAALNASELTPPLRARARFGDELLFLGTGSLPPVISGGDELDITLYYQSLPGIDRNLQPLIKLRTPRSGKAVLPAPVPLPGSPVGQYLIASVKVRVPQDIWPGETEVLISFLDQAGQALRIFGERGYELPLALTTVRPGVFPGSPVDLPSGEIPGEGIIDLGLGTVLSGRSAVSVRPESEIEVSGIGLVSYTMDTVPLPGGTEVARVGCRGDDGSLYEFPVRLGIESADVHLERWPANITGHLPAEIFSSEIIREGDCEFPAHSYRTLFRFPRPIRLEEIRISYDYPARGAWRVKRIFLLRE